MIARFAAALLLIALTACASQQAIRDDATPAQTVFVLKSDYKAVLGLAVQYESLPRCPDTESKACSDPDIVAAIRKADIAASAALDSAETIVRTPGATDDAVTFAITAAQEALNVLRKLLPEFVTWVPSNSVYSQWRSSLASSPVLVVLFRPSTTPSPSTRRWSANSAIPRPRNGTS